MNSILLRSLSNRRLTAGGTISAIICFIILGSPHTLFCASPLHGQDGSLSGTVTYRERIALPQGATLHLVITESDGEPRGATTIAEQSVPTKGRQVPIRFSIGYCRSLIKPNLSYRLKAEISFRGQTWFTSDQVEVLTRGNPDVVHLVMKRTP